MPSAFKRGANAVTHSWRVAAFFVALAVLTPVAVILWSLFTPAPEVWEHLSKHLLLELVSNTFWLVLGWLRAGSASNHRRK